MEREVMESEREGVRMLENEVKVHTWVRHQTD